MNHSWLPSPKQSTNLTTSSWFTTTSSSSINWSYQSFRMIRETFSNKILTLLSMVIFWMASRLNCNKIISLWTMLPSFPCIKKSSSMLQKIPKFKKNSSKIIVFPSEILSISTPFKNKSSWKYSIMTTKSKNPNTKTILKKLLSLLLHSPIVEISTNSFSIRFSNYKIIPNTSSNFKI